MAYQLFTDSGANLSEEQTREYNIKVISLPFIIEGKEYATCSNEDMAFAYKALRNKIVVNTSAASTYSIINALEEELRKGNDVLYYVFSSGLSSTYDNALLAKKKLEEKYHHNKIIIIDSLSAALGHGLLMVYAAMKQKEGATIDEVAKFLEDNKLKLNHLFTVDNMYFLMRGGRISKSTYMVARIAKIKPIMHTDNSGKLTAIGKVLGRKKSISELIELTIKTIRHPEDQYVFIAHGDCEDEANYIKEELSKRIKVKGFYVNYLVPTISAHSGPGTLAIFFLGDERI